MSFTFTLAFHKPCPACYTDRGSDPIKGMLVWTPWIEKTKLDETPNFWKEPKAEVLECPWCHGRFRATLSLDTRTGQDSPPPEEVYADAMEHVRSASIQATILYQVRLEKLEGTD